jgi:PRTRC genetic system ThiF family protein
MDVDTVTETNCVRQPFSTSDIGQNKATVLVNRINMFWGTKWSAEPSFFSERTLRRLPDEVPDLLIGCVDTRAARKVIDQALTRPMHATTYWLDIGNNAASGRYILGQPLNSRNRRAATRLRTVSELYPEIVDAAAGEDPLPSCSAIEALDRQEPFVNQTLASSALAMLARLFRYGKLNHYGAFFNAETGAYERCACRSPNVDEGPETQSSAPKSSLNKQSSILPRSIQSHPIGDAHVPATRSTPASEVCASDRDQP